MSIYIYSVQPFSLTFPQWNQAAYIVYMLYNQTSGFTIGSYDLLITKQLHYRLDRSHTNVQFERQNAQVL